MMQSDEKKKIIQYRQSHRLYKKEKSIGIDGDTRLIYRWLFYIIKNSQFLVDTGGLVSLQGMIQQSVYIPPF